jgi:hypothetical protein
LEACRPPFLTQTLTLGSHLLLFSVIQILGTPNPVHGTVSLEHTHPSCGITHGTAQGGSTAIRAKQANKQATYARSGRLDSHPSDPQLNHQRERERQEHPKTTRINVSHPIPYQSSAVSSHQTYTKRETPELSLEPPTILRQERATNFHVPSTSPLGPANSCASHVSHNTRDNGTISHQTTRALHSA